MNTKKTEEKPFNLVKTKLVRKTNKNENNKPVKDKTKVSISKLKSPNKIITNIAYSTLKGPQYVCGPQNEALTLFYMVPI